MPEPRTIPASKVYWTAFIGLFFDYYDLYLFVYLEKVFASDFQLSIAESNTLQFVGIAGVGLGSLLFGYLADRHGRGKIMLAAFAVYVAGIAGISLSPNYTVLFVARFVASLALGAEWGISHAFVSEHVARETRYRFAALLQFAILGGLMAAMASRFVLPHVGWRWLFAASIIPVGLLSVVRWKWLLQTKAPPASGDVRATSASVKSKPLEPVGTRPGTGVLAWAFARCFGIASLTIASGYVNVFFAKELPQSPWYTVIFWANVAPGMLLGAWIVRRVGVRRALIGYALGLVAISGVAWASDWTDRKLAFALLLPLLNGIPFGLMGAYFNEVFARYRTMLSGSAYNLGRIFAGFAPALITGLGLQHGGNYFLFTAALGLGVLAIGWRMADRSFEK